MRLSVMTAAVCLCLIGLVNADDVHAAVSKQTNIPAEGLGPALQTLAKDRNFQIVFVSEEINGVQTQGAIGQFTPEQALKALLKGTGFTYRFYSDHEVGIVPISTALPATSSPPTSSEQVTPNQPVTSQADSNIHLAQAQPDSKATPSRDADGPASAKKDDAQKTEGLEEIVVTGTLIHNIEPITPAITITGKQMTEQGYSRLDQVFDQLPQNFNSVAQASNPVIGGFGANSVANQFFASGVDLRGLGAGATLVLLNGRRLATTANGSAVDISGIPVSAIDRVEILTDGASAIYGSDAVAGVVNIITKRDFSGVETGVRSTEITKGKAPDYGGHVLGGYDWGSGNVLVNFDGERDNALSSTTRSFQPQSFPPFDLLPQQIRRSVFASARQEVSSQLSLTSDVLFSNRTFAESTNCCAGFGSSFGPQSGYAQQAAISLELDYAFAPEWNLKVSGQYSREKDLNRQFAPAVEPTAMGQIQLYTYKTSTLDAVVDGKVFELPGGAVRAAAGGQAKRESLLFEGSSVDSSGAYSFNSAGAYGDRSSASAFGELFIPIVGAPNAIPFVRKLNLDIAGRFDHYSDFGSTTNPKVSIQWVPLEGLTAHGSYSKSFRAPELFQLGAGLSQQALIYPEPNPASPAGTTTTLLLDGSNPNLQPERANTYNAGLTFKPKVLSGLKVDLDFFHIDYKDRIDRLILDGYFTTAITAADQLGSLVNLNPTLSEINAVLNDPSRQPIYNGLNGYCQVGTPGCVVDPSSIKAIANLGYVNVGVATVQGYDLEARYDWDTGVGRFYVDATSTLMTENNLRITPTTAPASQLNNTGQPLRLRAKANLGWSTATWSVYGRVNFANAYHNRLDPNCPQLPGCSVSSWTTFDSGIAYTTPKEAGVGGGIRVSLDVMNLFNRVPPYINPYTGALFSPAYDPLNANPLQRVLSVSVTKKW
jgi:iron complex outermembrane recepter protein